MNHVVLLSNHLNPEYLLDIDYDKATVLVCKQQFEFVQFHQFRIFYHMAAAMLFAEEHNISYVYVDTWDEFFSSITPDEIVYYYQPNDIWMKEQLAHATSHLTTSIKQDINFFHVDIEKEFGSPPYKMDPLYRRWRKQFHILMDHESPIGGSYSYDSKNRGRPPKTLEIEPPQQFHYPSKLEPLYQYVQTEFPNNPSSSLRFFYPLTHKEAQQLLSHFLTKRLSTFGLYQDAMMHKEPFMVHSILSTCINLGLLMAKDVVNQAVQAYEDGIAPIEAVEGFIRQILGWREYIRGVYLLEMKRGYWNNNQLENHQKKPSFLYDGNTDLFCMHSTVSDTIEYAYNHHIQRLMIIGNLTNLLEISPQEIRTWFNEMYIDSFDWVVTPNVIGMAMYADGGLLSTKPYISSANYIHKMSNYCEQCKYNPSKKFGEDACPVNALYYQFLHKHHKRFQSNVRMKPMFRHYQNLSSDALSELLDKAKSFQNQI